MMKALLEETLAERDQKVVWHPYTQIKSDEPPIAIVSGEGSYLFDEEGNRYIDAVSSWWVNLHGHAHPFIIKKIIGQLTQIEHVIFAGFTHEPAIQLAEKLISILPPNQKMVFFSDNGSTAVEAAIKMALQFWYNAGTPRRKIIALKNGYHGDTFGAMSVSERTTFTAPFNALLFDVALAEIPKTVDGLAPFISLLTDDVAAFIFEPLIQGTGGMLMYEPEIINQMVLQARKKGILTIADEVMTGFGRTGKLFAIDHLIEKPDMVCLSKGLTGGTMALGVTTCVQKIYDAFLSEDKTKTFFHGHSYTANPLACTAALASMDLLLRRSTQRSISLINDSHVRFAGQIEGHPRVGNVRVLGTILAIDWKTHDNNSYFSDLRTPLYKFFLGEGILLRPLGNTLYIMPPYCISEQDLNFIYEKIKEALNLF